MVITLNHTGNCRANNRASTKQIAVPESFAFTSQPAERPGTLLKKPGIYHSQIFRVHNNPSDIAAQIKVHALRRIRSPVTPTNTAAYTTSKPKNSPRLWSATS